MIKSIKLLLISLFFAVFNLNSDITTFEYKGQSITINWRAYQNNKVDITLMVNNMTAGKLYASEIDKELNWYYIEHLFIEPSYRENGYVKLLSKLIFTKFAQNGAKKIFCEPNPIEKAEFAFVSFNRLKDEERELKLPKLKKLYQYLGFIECDKELTNEFEKLTNSSSNNLMVYDVDANLAIKGKL